MNKKERERKGQEINRLIEGTSGRSLALPGWYKYLSDTDIEAELARQNRIATEIAMLRKITSSRNDEELSKAMSDYSNYSAKEES